MTKILRMQPARSTSTPDEKWGHVFSIGFSVQGKQSGDLLTEEDLLRGMEKRIKYLRANRSEIFAACGFPEEPGQGEERV